MDGFSYFQYIGGCKNKIKASPITTIKTTIKIFLIKITPLEIVFDFSRRIIDSIILFIL